MVNYSVTPQGVKKIPGVYLGPNGTMARDYIVTYQRGKSIEKMRIAVPVMSEMTKQEIDEYAESQIRMVFARRDKWPGYGHCITKQIRPAVDTR